MTTPSVKSALADVFPNKHWNTAKDLLIQSGLDLKRSRDACTAEAAIRRSHGQLGVLHAIVQQLQQQGSTTPIYLARWPSWSLHSGGRMPGSHYQPAKKLIEILGDSIAQFDYRMPGSLSCHLIYHNDRTLQIAPTFDGGLYVSPDSAIVEAQKFTYDLSDYEGIAIDSICPELKEMVQAHFVMDWPQHRTGWKSQAENDTSVLDMPDNQLIRLRHAAIDPERQKICRRSTAIRFQSHSRLLITMAT